MRRTADIRSSQILGMSTLDFAACFPVWTIFSTIGIGIKEELGLNETIFGLLIATPILTGSLFRMPPGTWSDRSGGRLLLVTVMLASAIATFLLALTHTYPLMLLFLVVAGNLLSTHAAVLRMEGVAATDRPLEQSIAVRVTT
jgi:NNP family nitrate/nitrite transporter-like MFS transporter